MYDFRTILGMEQKKIDEQKEEDMKFMIEFAKISTEYGERILKVEPNMFFREKIQHAMNVIEEQRLILKRIRREFAIPVVLEENAVGDPEPQTEEEKIVKEAAKSVHARMMEKRLRTEHLNEDKEEAALRG